MWSYFFPPCSWYVIESVSRVKDLDRPSIGWGVPQRLVFLPRSHTPVLPLYSLELLDRGLPYAAVCIRMLRSQVVPTAIPRREEDRHSPVAFCWFHSLVKNNRERHSCSEIKKDLKK